MKLPYKRDAFVLLHRIDGSPVRLLVNDINCWEEHAFRGTINRIVMVYHFLSSTTVRESFEDIDTMLNGSAVAHG